MRPGHAAYHSLPSSAVVIEEYSYTSTHPLGHTGPVKGSLYLYIYMLIKQSCTEYFQVLLLLIAHYMSMYSVVKSCLINYLAICSFLKTFREGNLCKPEKLYSFLSSNLH